MISIAEPVAVVMNNAAAAVAVAAAVNELVQSDRSP